MNVTPRDYQVEAVDTLFGYFRSNAQGNPVVAMPTGTGKSIVIALFLWEVFHKYGAVSQKILVLTHVKELIKQNYDELVGLWPQAPAGIYSSGLKRRDVHNNIIFAGIGSVAKRAHEFGRVSLVLIDEAHLVSQQDSTMYRKFLAQLMVTNPGLRVIGLTATPWRLGHGRITEGDDALFTDICFDITGVAAFNRLIAEGYLAPLVPKPTHTVLDVDGVHMRGGEFIQSELQRAVDRDDVTQLALQEAMGYGQDRQSWLIFCAGVEHAKHVADMLDTMGVPCGVVHSDMSDTERDDVFDKFKNGTFRALANNNIATTGFNHPPVDLILCLRPTASAVLWVQMLGRGTRPYDPAKRYIPGFDRKKVNCLVLDFAGNSKRLGPINDPVVPRRKGEKGGMAPIKLCEKCNTFVHASLVRCNTVLDDGTVCDNEFPRQTKLMQGASTSEIIKGELPVVEVFKVDHMVYSVHRKEGKPPSVKVAYYCGLHMFNDYVCIEHQDFAGKKALRWWRERCQAAPPATADELIRRHSELAAPTHLRVWVNQKYPSVLAYCYDGSAFGQQEPGVDAAPTADAIVAKPQPLEVQPQAPAPHPLDDDYMDDDIPF